MTQVYEHDPFVALRRSVALASAAAFLAANCARTNPALQSPGYTASGESLLYDELLAGVPSGMYFYHPNHLQSAVLVTNARGEEELRIHYLPFGEIDQNLTGRLNLETGMLEQTHRQVSIGSVAARYTDQALDYEIELMYYNARYYDPQLGVFTSADSVIPDGGDPLAYNRHAYVRGNPIRYSDPTGHFWWVVPFLVGALIGGVAAGTGGNIAGWVNGDVAFNWDAAWKGALVGGFAAVAGAWVSMALAAGASAAAQGSLGLAMGQGMMGGMASGFIGGAGGAWLNGASFWDGIGYGILGGSIGAFSGMVLAGVAHGLGKAWEVLQEPIELPNDGGPMNAYEIYENGKGGSLPLPATRNVSGRGMGSQIHPITKQPSFHDGIDQAASIGTEIPAVRAGVVRYAGSYRNYGNYVLIDHGNGISTGYAHLKDTYVVIGQKVYQGMSIGTVGMTGMTTGPHLHFNVIKTASITQTSINGRHVSGWIFINPMGAW